MSSERRAGVKQQHGETMHPPPRTLMSVPTVPSKKSAAERPTAQSPPEGVPCGAR